uniref:ABC transporter substrate-binding protein n=1 Tax=Thermoplasma sp. TaxID=1973142 RepID=UPI002609D6E3
TSNSGISFPYPTVYSNLNVSNTKYAANYLANMLSHFEPWSNTTQAALISYPNQAVYVPNYNKTMYTGGNQPLNVTIKLLKPYPFFLQDMAEWWGNIADPMFIDNNDGVLAASPNNYTDANGMPGTGPYYISGVQSSLSSVTLTKAPDYWGNAYWSMPNHGGLPAIAQPAHIGVVVMDFPIDHSGRVSGFLDNTYQISVVSSSYLSSIIGQGSFKNIPLNAYFQNFGANPAVFYISMNNYLYPTNNTYFRMALWYGTNYSALNTPFYYTEPNGTKLFLAQDYIGPISPGFANFYNNATAGLQPPTYNLALAEHYLNIAGQQEHFFVTLPNGTKLGDVSSSSTTAQIVLSVGSLLDNMLMAPVKIF